ncbi:class I SAM-dependent methyltransferase [Rhodothermus profundi]|uniref:Ubiquinone/menaquinone biosynthesis C-methylase UbiE n=1 Tax=Rhodothermus profundi TaxID=633813 RepID=A0A1M6QMC4_9BACT|nr:class I SAM-dependent methyltransferase [Rhodothermus profundi]SHK21391.1 Ubiquinone/menaquinone biosynthesis C-methylase UbiE [Rhodothermus profundi]
MSWYEDWFNQDEYELVYHRRDEREAEQVVDLIEQLAQPAPGSEILDVGCGRGRHARVLARRGYRVTGIDVAERALQIAQARAAAEGLSNVRFVRHDMRNPFCQACFDGVVNLFTAFGFFEEDADHFRAIRAMATALRPGGWLVQDFLNADYVQRYLVPRDQEQRSGIEVIQERWIENGRVNKRIRLRRDGQEQIFYESVRLLRLEDFQQLYRAAGLTLEATRGDYAGGPFTPDSPRLILYARKTAA